VVSYFCRKIHHLGGGEFQSGVFFTPLLVVNYHREFTLLKCPITRGSGGAWLFDLAIQTKLSAFLRRRAQKSPFLKCLVEYLDDNFSERWTVSLKGPVFFIDNSIDNYRDYR
jgi:hypothetical protein